MPPEKDDDEFAGTRYEDPENRNLTPGEISDALGYDPFGKDVLKGKESEEEGKKPSEPAAKEKGDGEGKPAEPAAEPEAKDKKPEPKAAEAPAKAAPVEPSGEPTPKVAEPPADAELALLKKANADLTATVTRLSQPTAVPKAEPAPGPEAAKAPDYNVRVPDDLLGMLRGEDPEAHRSALSALIQATATTVHSRVMQEVRSYVEEYVPKTAQEVYAATVGQGEVRTDFYQAYPQFNNDAARLLVVSESMQLAAETGATEWTPQFRDAVAARVTQVINGLREPSKPVVPVAEETPKAPHVTSPNTSPGGVGGEDSGVNSESDIVKTLFGQM